jgi:hypothetical protein
VFFLCLLSKEIQEQKYIIEEVFITKERKKQQARKLSELLLLKTICAHDRVRTCNLRFRKPILYPVELRRQKVILAMLSVANIQNKDKYSSIFIELINIKIPGK